MFSTMEPKETASLHPSLVEPQKILDKELDESRAVSELRRQMYERIAEGNALVEAEECARRQWRR